MLKKIITIASVFVSILAFQTSADAEGRFAGKQHRNYDHYSRSDTQQHRYYDHNRRHNDRFSHKKRHQKADYLTNRELRYVLRHKGLRRIEIRNRYDGIAKVVAFNRRGHLAKYKVSTRTGKILHGRVIRRSHDHRPRDYHRSRDRYDGGFGHGYGNHFVIRF